MDIPWISEKTEQGILETVINTIDDKLDEVAADLPPPFSELWAALEGGISDEEAEQLVNALVGIANEKINIPMLSEEQEANLIMHPVIELIVQFVQEKTSGVLGAGTEA